MPVDAQEVVKVDQGSMLRNGFWGMPESSLVGSLPSHGGGGGGLGRAMPRCRHIGCVVSHGAAAVSCCVRVIGTCVTCVTCAGRATMTRRGGSLECIYEWL